jgi:hypothetical protein
MGFLARFRRGPRLTPTVLARKLFAVFVLHDEDTIMAEECSRARREAVVRPDVFERQRFAYLIASVTLAINSIKHAKRMVPEIMEEFQRLVSAEVVRRQSDEAATNAEIQSAIDDCIKLIFTDPSTDRGLSFDWPMAWLHRVGIEETNPQTLFSISIAWKNHFHYTAQFLSQVRVVRSR